LAKSKIQGKIDQKISFLLPSEAEWEKAARGPEGNDYPWGHEFDISNCNTQASGTAGISPVEKYSPHGDSFYGVGDMAGNVWEWMRDLWDDEQENKKVLNGNRVLRGGAFTNSWKVARCATRHYGRFDRSSTDVGFRICISPIS